MAAAGAMYTACLPSTSGRLATAQDLRCSAAPLFGSRLQVTQAQQQRPITSSRPAFAVKAAAFGGNKGAYKKYMSRQDLEVAYFKEWEATTVLAEEEGRRKMTALTLLAFLPNFVKFYLVPGPVRYVWYLVWRLIQEGAYQLRKRAVIAGAKLDMATMQRRGIKAQYAVRQTALRRLHGKQSLLGPIKFAVGGQMA